LKIGATVRNSDLAYHPKALSKSDPDQAKHEGVAVTSTGALR
jgi:hypothetical protein